MDTNKAPAIQSNLDRTSVFPRREATFRWKYVEFFEWERKSAKTWLEVTFDLTGQSEWVKNANCVKKSIIF